MSFWEHGVVINDSRFAIPFRCLHRELESTKFPVWLQFVHPDMNFVWYYAAGYSIATMNEVHCDWYKAVKK